jgi:DNA replication protein DnaC
MADKEKVGGILGRYLEDINRRRQARKEECKIEGISMDDGYQRFRRRQAELERQQWIEDKSGMPPRAVNALLRKEIDLSKAVCRRVMDAVEDGIRLVAILGAPGTGKTVAACRVILQRRIETDELAMVDDYAKKPSAGVFVTATKYTTIAPWEALDTTYANARFLVLDDVGREHKDKRAQIEDLLFKRFDEENPTVFTANLAPEKVGSVYDERLLRRLVEDGEIIIADEVLRPVRKRGKRS